MKRFSGISIQHGPEFESRRLVLARPEEQQRGRGLAVEQWLPVGKRTTVSMSGMKRRSRRRSLGRVEEGQTGLLSL